MTHYSPKLTPKQKKTAQARAKIYALGKNIGRRMTKRERMKFGRAQALPTTPDVDAAKRVDRDLAIARPGDKLRKKR